MAQELLLVRHAKTAPEFSGRYVGVTDARLDPEWPRQTAALLPALAQRRPARCYCSPLSRTQETARALCQSVALNVEVVPDLREVDFGKWEGLSFPEVAARDPKAAARWAQLDDDFTFPEGESLAAFWSRIASLGNRLAADPAERILAVTHGGVIRALICHYLGLAPRNHLLFEVHCASLTTIKLFEGRGVLAGLNEFQGC